MTKVRALGEVGLASVYHELHNETHGQETIPTHYRRDRREDSPTYHIDFVFLPPASVNSRWDGSPTGAAMV